MEQPAPNVVIVSAVYPPEPVVSGRMSQDLAQVLTESGSTVRVVCPFPSRPLGAAFPEFHVSSRALCRNEAGVEVWRIPSFSSPRSTLCGRMRESFSFGWRTCHYIGSVIPRGQVVYVNSFPLLSQFILAWFCVAQGIPLVLHIQDVYPESMLAKVPGSVSYILGGLLARIDRWTASQATRLVVISENMFQIYCGKRGVPAAKIVLCPTWQDDALFAARYDRTTICRRYNVDAGKFTFLYLGNIGPVAGVETLILAFEAAKLADAQLLIIGDGTAKNSCTQLVERNKIAGVYFMSDRDANNVPILQCMGDVFLLPVSRGAASTSIPSKLPAYLFSGRPILASVDASSDTAHHIEQSQCGWVVEPSAVLQLAKKMVEIVALPKAELARKGDFGRNYGLEHFSKTKRARELAAIVLAVAKEWKADSAVAV